MTESPVSHQLTSSQLTSSQLTSSQLVSLRRRASLSPKEVARANRHLATAAPAEVVGWAAAQFGPRLVLTASFADTTLIDIATGVDADIEVIFLDTGFHFAETLATVRSAMERYELDLTVLRPDPAAVDLWAQGTTECCAARKSDPLDRHLATHADAWMSGVRRTDHGGRADTPIVSIDRRGLVKVNPMATMTEAEHQAYVVEHNVVRNPLHEQGYASIGCWPSADGRAGRSAGIPKTECGLHL